MNLTTKPRVFSLRRTGLLLAALLAVFFVQTGVVVPAAHAEPLPQASGTPLPEANNDQPTPEPETSPTPTEPAPLPPGTDVAPAVEAAQTLPPPPNFSAAQKAVYIAVNEAINGRGEMALAYFLYQVKIDRIEMSKDGRQAAAWLAFLDPETGQVIATEPAVALAKKGADGKWQVTLQFDTEWEQAVAAAPSSLLTQEMKADLQPPAELSAAAGQVFSGYKLPWKGGTYSYITGSVGHVLTYKSCPTTCRYAFDFADGTMFPIHAARAGKVKYAAWSYANGNTENANYIVLEDTSTTPTTYQVYYHLAKDSIPTELRTAGAAVNQGQFIGNADDTGASTGHHLHFHVHTTAGAVWGTSVDITFDDVTENGGRPRTCSEASTYPDYGNQCSPGNKLLSGNQAGPVPAAPEALGPTGRVWALAPTYQWKAVNGATQYNLVVTKTGATSSTVNQSVNSSACTDGVCSFKPTTNLTVGEFSFKLRAGSGSGWSDYSTPLTFTVSPYPDVPELVSPGGTITIKNPAYTWKPVQGATKYYLQVYSEKSASNIIYRQLDPAVVCGAETCSYTSTINVGHGAYKFRVRAGSAAGWSAYTPYMSFFAYLAPYAPELVGPNAAEKVRVQRPAYSWKASAGATKYGLRVYSLAKKAYVASYDVSATYLCTGEDCWYKPSVNLVAGEYQFRVRAYNSFGWGDYSDWMPFSVQLVPDAPTLVSPTGTTSNLSPAYTWNQLNGPTSYYLMVWDVSAGEYLIYRGKNTADVCNGTTCSYVSTLNVEPGKSYRFKVRAYNSFGWGAYSPEMEFSVAP